MIKIPETFNKYGYTFKLLQRTDKVALYEQSKLVSSNLTVKQYEVHLIRLQEECVFKDTVFEEHEKLSGKKDFGLFGWSYHEYENAIKKFKELVEEQNV